MALSARRRQLLESERWRALGAFVERWYLRPLSDGDGNTAHELAHAVARLARPLPGALAEWYELIGRRLRPGQDTPRLLAELSVEAGRIRTLSFGKERPVEVCSDEACYAKNRRAVTVVSQGGVGS